MNQTENRSEIYENNLRTIEESTNAAITARTLARSFIDYGELIHSVTFSAVGDYARDDLIEYCDKQATHWTDYAKKQEAIAAQAQRETTS